ncbi:MAG: methyltransferase domain-containing protein [Magnetococcales bacterium]|nr:methyltransferase domain-containing protein [Magnetococcales bacterium]MBF0156684.1 methyltransferase domain-containing protein [Magnetococcales bacterium]
MTPTPRFFTPTGYTDRRSKAAYVWRKYGSILQGEILDVGADECHLRPLLPSPARYTGIGLSGQVDRVVDLDREPIPFDDGRFDCVLCLEVLEHLERIHAVFDDLCRVSRKYMILSLPNPWGSFYKRLLFDFPQVAADCPVKFYGLPNEPPEDRHRWFYSPTDARRFVAYRAARNGMRILQEDAEEAESEGVGFGGWLRRLARRRLLRQSLDPNELLGSCMWWVLEKPAKEP